MKEKVARGGKVGSVSLPLFCSLPVINTTLEAGSAGQRETEKRQQKRQQKKQKKRSARQPLFSVHKALARPPMSSP